MPYFISNKATGCSGWATIKEDGEVMGCHTTKAAAVKQMVAISLAENMQPGGERNVDGPKAIIVDVDDTLIHMGEPMDDVIEVLNAMDGSKLIVTARPISQREETVRQLREAGVNYTALFLKDTDEATSTWKGNVAERLLARYNIVLAVDNDENNLRAFRALGIKSITPSELKSDMETNNKPAHFQVRDLGDWEYLNERQQKQAENLAEQALEFGMFDQSTGANGAHYAPAANNPFKAEGLICDNCIFYNENAKQCQIVEGILEDEAVCKLWIIPENKIGMPEETVEEMNARWKSVTLNLRSKQGADLSTNVERRVNSVDFDVRQAEVSGNGMSFKGYAAVFDSPSEPLPFTEVIREGAFKRSLKSRNEIKLFMNHNTDVVLGSTRSGTLRLTEDSRGLLAEADLPDTTAGRDLSVLMQRGDVSKMSFGFSVPPRGDRWSEDGATRELHQIRLHEVSIVTGFPAYEATTASVRSLDILATRTAVDVDTLSDAITKLEAGETLDASHADLISEVVAKLRASEPANLAELEIKRKQLDLMAKVF